MKFNFKLGPVFKGQKNRAAAKAAFTGDFDAAFAMVDRGADINSSYYVGDPDDGGGEGNIGYSAIRAGNLAALEKALDKGLDVNLQSYYRQPLLVYAIMQKQEEAGKLLINRGADVTGNDYLFSDIFSPLTLTRFHQMPEVGRMIEERLSPKQLETARAADLFPVDPGVVSKAKKLNL
jgi:hypothetical protein